MVKMNLNKDYLVFSLLKSDDVMDNYYIKNVFTVVNPFCFKVCEIKDSNNSTQEAIIRTIENHVKRNGTVKEIIISGHGGYCQVNGGDAESVVDVSKLLNDLVSLEKKIGKKITNRIVFDGCRVFAELTDEKINTYSKFAKEHKIEIVGSTSDITDSLFTHAGRFVEFTTNGKIIRDAKRDCPYNLYSLSGNDISWTDYYIGHTPEEGAILKKTHEIHEENERKAAAKRQEWDNKRADRGPKF